LRRGLAILGAEKPNVWLKAEEWAMLAAKLGLIKALISAGDRDSQAGCVRGMGVTMSAHLEETFEGENESDKHQLKLEKKRKRWDGHKPHCRYRFAVLDCEDIPLDEYQVLEEVC
jgi:hypothetical protein